MTHEELKRQIDEFVKCNIRSVYILPEPREFRPNSMDTHLDGYLGEKYLADCRFAYDYALKKGMQVWLYDEGGWPSGSANGEVVLKDPTLIKRTMTETVKQLEMGERYTLNENTLAAFDSNCVRIQKDFTAAAGQTVYEYTIQSGYYTNMPYPDLLNPKTTTDFLKYTHERYRDAMGDLFGEDFMVAFTDEPSIAATVWSEDLTVRFEEKYGYSFLDYLPAIVGRRNMGERGEQARIDYCDLCGELFADRYFKTLQNWCRDHGMLSAGHINGEDETLGCVNYGFMNGLRLLRCFDIPGVDTIWRQIFPAPRSTERRTECANLFFPRYASSAANQTSCRSTLSESYAIYGEGITFEQMRYVMNFQAIRGVNIFNIMYQNYCSDHHFMAGARPSYSPLMPGGYDKAAFHEYMARVSTLCATGTPVAETALYMPIRDFWAYSDAEYKAEMFEQTGLQLEANQCSFDVFDDDVIESCDETALDQGVIKLGFAGYHTLWFPPCERVPQKIKEKLERFIRGGGKVYIAKGKYDPQIRGAVTVEKIEDYAEATVRCLTPNRYIRAMKREAENGTLVFVSNESFGSTDACVAVSDTRPAYELDALTGRIYPAGEMRDGGQVFALSLRSGEMKVWLFTDDPITCDEKLPEYPEKFAEIETFRFRRIRSFVLGEERMESIPLNEQEQTVQTGDWRPFAGEDFSGDGVYAAEFAVSDTDNGITIDLGQVNYSCELFLNGKSQGVCCMSPYRYNIKAEELREKNLLEIRVSNTAANQYVYSSTFDKYSPNVIGPYHATTLRFEKESLASGLFGPVTLWK